MSANAMGRDKIHNLMIKNLTDTNKKHLLHLLNSMLQSSFVPADWKQATIIPIRKPDKPADSPESYRPISLTSCLGKVMEKIINRRLVWTFEKQGLRLKTQAGFRKGRCTMDNIIGLEHFIREGFNKRRPINTYAIFLDVAKAFDTTWIQGLIYKLTNGVNGKILGWLNPLLRNRTYCVRIGNTHSDDRALKIGVLQGSPLSPFLFSVMMDD